MLTVAHHSELIGDSICALPALWEAAWQRGPIQVWMKNQAVPSLLRPSSRITWLDREPPRADHHMHAHLGLGRALYSLRWHMRQAYFAQVGLPIPERVPAFPVYVPIPAVRERCDVLISPFSRSDQGHNKAWYTDRWADLLRVLHARGLRLGIIGSADQEQASETVALRGAIGSRFAVEGWGRPLAAAMALIRDAGACVSIDNGVSHLISAMGRPHVLLYPACLPFTWVRDPNPGAEHVIGWPQQITVARVIEAFDRCTAKRRP